MRQPGAMPRSCSRSHQPSPRTPSLVPTSPHPHSAAFPAPGLVLYPCTSKPPLPAAGGGGPKAALAQGHQLAPAPRSCPCSAPYREVLGCRAQALHPGAVLSPPGTTKAPCPCGAAGGTRVPARPGSLPSAGLGSRSQSGAVGILCLYLQSSADPEAGRRMSQLPAQSRIPPRAGAAALLSVQTGTVWRGGN